MAMSRKHYIKAARLLRAWRQAPASPEGPDHDNELAIADKVEDFLVELFQDDNPNFREAQFRKAAAGPQGAQYERVSRKRALAEGWVRPWESEA